MTKFIGTFSVATAVLLLAAVAGCGSPSDGDSPHGGSQSPNEGATDTTGPPNSPEAEASAAAVEAVRNYYAVIDQLRQDPSTSIDGLDSVAVSTQLSAQKNFLSSQRNDGLRQVGNTKVIETKVQTVSLDNSDPSAGRVPSVAIDVCWDIGAADLLDSTDTSVVPPDRPERGWTRLIVANYVWDTDPEGGWRIASGEDLKKAPCKG